MVLLRLKLRLQREQKAAGNADGGAGEHPGEVDQVPKIHEIGMQSEAGCILFANSRATAAPAVYPTS